MSELEFGSKLIKEPHKPYKKQDSRTNYDRLSKTSFPSLKENQNPKEEDEEELEMHTLPKEISSFDFEEELDFKIVSDSTAKEKRGITHIGSQSSQYTTNGSSQTNSESHKQYISKILESIKDSEALQKIFETYHPKNRDINIVEIKQSTRTKTKRYRDCVYFGEIINSKRHGKGIMFYADNRIYEGEWENDLKHGRGLEILSNGNRYEGQFLNGKPEGIGNFIWTNGEIYEGEWKNGLKHGSGMWRGTKGESYVGEWKNGKADGYGVHTWRNGDRYEGEMKGFLKHGHGTEKFINGDFYVGNYINGKPDGYGEYYWSNGCQYKGQFKNGLRHGKGVWKKAVENSDVYDGEWINDKKCGQGNYTWASGNSYRGAYFDDMRHGYGEMCWKDGSYYKGQWERGIQHGEGELLIPDRALQKGMFENNVFIGETEGDFNSSNLEAPFANKNRRESTSDIHKDILPEIRGKKDKNSERSHSQVISKACRGNVSYNNGVSKARESPIGKKEVGKLNNLKERSDNDMKKLKDIKNLEMYNNTRKSPLPQTFWRPAGKYQSSQKKD